MNLSSLQQMRYEMTVKDYYVAKDFISRLISKINIRMANNLFDLAGQAPPMGF